VTRLTTCADPRTVAERAASQIALSLRSACEQRGSAHLALSGGTTPKLTYELLAKEDVDWSAVHVWFADERCVDPGDPESNYRLAAESLLKRANVVPAHNRRWAHGDTRWSSALSSRSTPTPRSPSLT
jgi:6-phosphogluconolactonase